MIVADQPTISDAQIKRTWEGMLGAEIRSAYFADLVSRYNTQQQVLTWLTLFLSSGALITILTALPTQLQWIRVVLIAASAALSFLSIVKQNQKHAVDASKLQARWLKIANLYTSIWEDVYAPDAKEKLDAATVMDAEASEAGNAIPYNERLMRKWEQHVVVHHQ